MSDSNNKKLGGQILRDKLQKSLRERLSRNGGPSPEASRPATATPPASEAEFLSSLEEDISRELAQLESDFSKTKPFGGASESPRSPAVPEDSPAPPSPSPDISASPEPPRPSRVVRPAPPPKVYSPFAGDEADSLSRSSEPADPPIFSPDFLETRERSRTPPSRPATPPPPQDPRVLAHSRENPQDTPPNAFASGGFATHTDQEAETAMTDDDSLFSDLHDLPEKKSGSGKGTTLRAPSMPRRPDPEEETQSSPPDSTARRRDAGLRSPSIRNAPRPAAGPSEDLSFAPQSSKTHEQEVFEAIRREDVAWIEKFTRSDEIPSPRQEILMVAALPRHSVLSALLSVGFSFDESGLSVKTAISKGYWNCVEVFQRSGASFDVDTLKKIAAWRREQAQKAARAVRKDPPAPAPSPALSDAPVDSDISSIDSEFAQFLVEHSAESPSPDPEESFPSSEPEAEGAESFSSSMDIADELSAALSPSLELDIEPEPEPEPERRPAPRQPIPEPPARPVPASRPAAPANAHADSAPLTAMERAKLKTLERIMAEKQALEQRVMELEAFAEAAETLEAERSELLARLEASESLLSDAEARAEQAEARAGHSALEKNRAAQEASQREIARLRSAEQNLSSLLSQAEADLAAASEREINLQQRLEDLEHREPPPVEAVDILARDGLDKTMRKSLFISQILKGETHTLEKIALNSSVEREEASYAIAFAAEAGQIDAADWILRHLDGDLHIGGELALLRALENGQIEMAFWLIGKGANFHHADEFALRWSCRTGDIETLDRLVALGANVHAGNGRALREAFALESWEAFRALLCHGASPLSPSGEIDPEMASSPEALEIIQWSEAQRKSLLALDPAFLDRILPKR